MTAELIRVQFGYDRSVRRAYDLYRGKPRIYREGGWWLCIGRGFRASGLTPKLAYVQWSLVLWPPQTGPRIWR